MPGTAAHLTIIEEQTKRAKANPAQYGVVASALSAHPRHAYLGAIGPDMIFWADWGSYTDAVNALFDFYKTLDEIYDKVNALWGPIQKAIDKVEDTLTGGLSTEIGETVDLVGSIVKTGMLSLITKKVHYWNILKPAFQVPGKLVGEAEWNWLDHLHSRRTGEFTRALIARARKSGDAAQMAYAYGWLSHVTADVVGHAYVNQAVGGPWRLHSQRHHIQENFMDAWVWGFYHTPGVKMPASPTPGAIPFDYAKFANVNTANLHLKIALGDDLPGSLSDLIADTLQEVYAPHAHPKVIGGFLDKGRVNRAYQQLSFALELISGKDRHVGKPKPPSVFGDDELPSFPTPGGGGGSSSGGGGGSFSLSSMLDAIFDFIKDTLGYLGELAAWLVSQVTHALTYPVRYALYLIQLGLYNVFRQFRWALVVSGYVLPEPDELASGFAQQFINPLGLVAEMPRKEREPYVFGAASILSESGEEAHSQFYPTGGTEEPLCTPGPYTRHPANYPWWFIEGEPSDLGVERALTEANTPDETMRLTRRLFASSPRLTSAASQYKGALGSAVDFFLRRAGEVADGGGGSGKLNLPNWSLDADRGYAFKCWRALSPLSPPNGAGNANDWGVKIAYEPAS